MTFTKEQLDILAKYEDNFRTAINADWSRVVGRTGVATIWDIWVAATGTKIKTNPNCSHCVLMLLKDVGHLYFQDKEEMQWKAVNEQRKVEASAEEKPVVRKSVKTASKKPASKKNVSNKVSR